MCSVTDDVRSPQPLIDLCDVTVSRPGHSLLEQVSWQVLPGQHWVVLGPNGAGKTTLARLLTGREQPAHGSAAVLGDPVGQPSASDIAARIGIASVDVGQRLLSAEKVLDVVMTAAWGQTIRFREDYEDVDISRAQDLLDSLGISALASRTLGTLSEGERRRVLLARSLMADPEILILDEPTAGLDLGGRETLVTALEEIMGSPSTPAVVLITHELEAITSNFTHALLLVDGQVAAVGAIEDVITDANFSSAFGLELQVSQRNGRWRATAPERN